MYAHVGAPVEFNGTDANLGGDSSKDTLPTFETVLPAYSC